MTRSVDAKHLRGPRPPLSVIRERRRFVTAGQDGVVQIRHVGLSGIKRYDHSLTLCIYPDVAHTRDAHERFSQFADAFIAIFAFCRDCDSLQHRFIRAVRVMRVRWIEMLRIKWFDHPSVYAPPALCHPERSEGPRRWSQYPNLEQSPSSELACARYLSVRLSVAQVYVILACKVRSLACARDDSKK